MILSHDDSSSPQSTSDTKTVNCEILYMQFNEAGSNVLAVKYCIYHNMNINTVPVSYFPLLDTPDG